ncbi:phosphoenolpyruvate--protein phosphotransferase [Pelagibius litoralis]|uniref:Phosphoenolpyruvate-protein phosphotransferase n=1 Tax=Pelagibius litoralis TaxID=374515 RepID=A0A967CB88_9PROT|nr:phosphoenolpyruvate--protein phosphotransferase [Pelagibius litoralis]NIA68009.1 phosphoenolpyruvate--protein phosphotransferase [Pelagibius litoralis]
MKTDSKSRRRGQEQVFEGLGVSPGVGIGPAYVREAGDLHVPEYQIPVSRVSREKKRFAEATAKAIRQVGKLKAKSLGIHGLAAEELGYLLDAHLQMLKSSRLIGGIEAQIGKDRRNAESAVMTEISAIAQDFAAMEDAYLSARADDVREVGHRILRNLTDTAFRGFTGLERDSIVISEEISPADTALMDPREIAGFACILGGAEGHTAIMARSLGLPAVLGVPGLIPAIKTGDVLIVDGSNGLVIVNPTAKRQAAYQRRLKDMAREVRSLARLRDIPAETRDGQRITLEVNLELPREVDQAALVGAEGVGLLRTEFMYMNRDDLPGEDEQYAALAEIVRTMRGRPVTVRTLDVGGEKLASSLGDHLAESQNPALGLRAIRLSLKEPKLLRTQLAAILRAGAHGPLRILLPMISNPGEVIAVRKELDKTARRLRRRDVSIADPLPPLGVMIEVPGAALAADSLAQTCDFFAIGTNDLTMYTLAIDRSEEQVAYLYNPLHPAVLRLIQFSVEAALHARIPVSVCGEMAGDPRFAALLVGLGVRELSMTAKALPRVKSRILGLDMQAAGRRARMIMDQVDSGRIATLLDDFNDTVV